MALDHRQQSEILPKVWVLTHTGLEPLLRSIGAPVNRQWVVGDLSHQRAAALTRDAQGKVLFAEHPLYPEVISTAHPISGPLHQLTVPMSPLLQVPSDGIPLLNTHSTATAFKDLRSLKITEAKDKKEVGSVTLAYALERVFESTFEGTPSMTSDQKVNQEIADPPHLKRGQGLARLVFVGSGRRFLSADPKGLDFILAALEWVRGEEALLKLRKRRPAPPQLNATQQQRHLIQWGAAVIPFVLLLGISLWSRKWRW